MFFYPAKYVGENEGQEFFAPEGKYELYFSELAVGKDNNGNKTFSGKVVFMDGPRKGKYFFHNFGTEDYYGIYNSDSAKREKALKWLGNFFRAINSPGVDLDTESDKLINKTFWGDVTVNEYKGKKSNQLEPWGFHAGKESVRVEKTLNPPIHADKPSAASSDIRYHESDIPF